MKWYKYDIRDLTDEEYNKYFSFMSPEKQQRVNKFRFVDDKKRTVAGEMLARKAIAEWCSVDETAIVFYKNEHDKPYLKDLSCHFNISHSGDFVVCAISENEIGIDIEKIRPIDLKIAKKICTETELKYLFNGTPNENDFNPATEDELLSRFFKLWTAKEAYGKCKGVGVDFIDTLTLEYFSIELSPGYILTIYEEFIC